MKAFFRLLLAVLLTDGTLAIAQVNVVVIKEVTGVTLEHHPIQLGRPFLQGEIPEYPQALLNGQPVATQADVKIRYADGSVRHAILSFILPSLPAHGTVQVTFRNQATGNNDGYLETGGMLKAGFDFEAVMQLAHGSNQTLSASARKMIEAGAYSYWMKGPIATSVIIADHSVQRKFDIGFDGHRSFRPIFLATFWPGINRVWVRSIGENACSEALQDQSYSVTLKSGHASPATVYAESNIIHTARSRWTRTHWLGAPLPVVQIDHNLPYLIATRFAPSYETTRKMPENRIAAEYARYRASDTSLYGRGDWEKDMGNVGGRKDIGLMTGWVAAWLCNFDWRLEQIALTQAELFPAWGYHYREGSPRRGGAPRHFDREHTSNAVGRPISLAGRPTFSNTVWDNTASEDRIRFAGPQTRQGWALDGAHWPDNLCMPYVLTGDYFYLEESWFASFWLALNENPNPTASYGRGLTGCAGITGQTRAQAWNFRMRVHTAFITPTGLPEKRELGHYIEDALAVWEGYHDQHNGHFAGDARWTWGHDVRQTKAPSPLHLWNWHSDFGNDGGFDSNVVAHGASPWMNHFVIIALGRALELGYAEAEKNFNWAAQFIVDELTHPDYNPYYCAVYRMPAIRKSDGKYFQTWAETKACFRHWKQPEWTAFPQEGCAYCYPQIALAAASYVAEGSAQGATAWSFISKQLLPSSALVDDPTWALVPRPPLNNLADASIRRPN